MALAEAFGLEITLNKKKKYTLSIAPKEDISTAMMEAVDSNQNENKPRHDPITGDSSGAQLVHIKALSI